VDSKRLNSGSVRGFRCKISADPVGIFIVEFDFPGLPRRIGCTACMGEFEELRSVESSLLLSIEILVDGDSVFSKPIS
jgi:hypothetical protein